MLSQETFINRAVKKHGERYDYSQTVYTNSHTKITIICPLHGIFIQKACAHLLYGCRQCGLVNSTRKRRSTIADFINKAGQIHHYKYDYKMVQFERQHEKIEIICPKHGVFHQAANDHLKGCGCWKCGKEAASIKKHGKLHYTTEDFIQRSIEVHGQQYSYEKTVYNGFKEPVTITCNVHGDFVQSAYYHLQGSGCLKCARIIRQTRTGKRGTSKVLFEEFEERARTIHGDKYDYKYFTQLADKVGIECPKHGLFAQTGNDHIYAKAGCPFCAHLSIREQLRYTKDEFETKLTEKYEDRIVLNGNYSDFTTSTSFSCLAHGDFIAEPWQVLSRKHGCRQCWQVLRGSSARLTQEEFEQRASIAHNNKYQYGIYSTANRKIQIECPKHGLFRQNAGNHLAGMGCPTCGQHKTEMQNKWLDQMGINEREVWLILGERRIKADGYDQATNTVYEFWGDFWHGNPRIYAPDEINHATGTTFGHLYERTLNKRQLITSHGMQLIEIWEQDWKRINGKTT